MGFRSDYQKGRKLARLTRTPLPHLYAFIYACEMPGYQSLKRQVAYGQVISERKQGLRP